jgi:hypothetical protein
MPNTLSWIPTLKNEFYETSAKKTKYTFLLLKLTENACENGVKINLQ